MSDAPAAPRSTADPVRGAGSGPQDARPGGPSESAAPRGRGAAYVPAIFVLNLVCQIGIIVTGGLVRLTGSGLGCPTWPQCVPGSYVPTREMATSFHPYIEFGNRTLTFVLSVAALGVLWAVYRPLAHRVGLRLPAWLLLLGIGVQAVVGGISVRFDLNPFIVSLHFVISAGLVAVSTYLLHRLREGDRAAVPAVPPLVARLAWATAGLGGVVVLLGTLVTGSGPHSGDADTPHRNGLDPRMISWLHADAVMLFVGLSVGVAVACYLTQRGARPARAWAAVLAMTAAQGLVGYLQFFTGLPEGLVLTHMLLAALFVVALTNGILALRSR